MASFILTLYSSTQSHHVLLLGLVHNTYLDHAVLIDVHVVIENDDENIVRVVAPKQIDRFSPMKLVLSS